LRRRAIEQATIVKQKVQARVEKVVAPARRAITFIKQKLGGAKINPYEVTTAAVEMDDEAQRILTFEESLAALQKVVDDLAEQDRLADKFELKGADEEAAVKRKRKLNNLRKRLEAKQDMAEDMIKRKQENEEKVERDRLIKEAEEAVEKAKEKFKVVAQLSEAIRLAHRGVQTAAHKVLHF
jgi:hypothetical protein